MDDNMLRDGLAALALMALAWGSLGTLARRFGGNQAGASLLVTYAISSLATGTALFLLGRLGASPLSVLVVILLGAGALVVACLGIQREVIMPSRVLDDQLAQAADGDLDSLAEAHLNGTVGGIAQRVSLVFNRLRATVVEVQIGAQDLFGAGEAILTVMAQQSAGVGAQIAAVAETTATVEEVKASAQQATQLAESVAATAREADRIAAVGVGAIQDATVGMTHIRERVESIADQILALSEQSQQIGEIITTVGDLADQSNMLALNAAIEAARAGEHGRGFAVVAQEIRVLAEQSKLATAQVRTILSDIQRVTNAAVMATEQGTKGVDAGAKLIDRAGETIVGLAMVIQDTSTSAQQITVSVQQHSIGMDQIVAAMIDIQRVTEQNGSAGVASRQAAEALIELAQRLNASVQRYHATPNAPDIIHLPPRSPDASVGFDFSSEMAA
jgi:methyl-accepting chemotaxis protein